MAFPIQIDATALTSPSFSIAGVTRWLETKTPQTVQFEPGTFSVQTPAGQDASWSFAVTPHGTVEYDATRDVSQGGFLSGRGTVRLGLVGYDITIDATALTLEQFEISAVISRLDANQVHVLRLLPRADYHVALTNGSVTGAEFQVLAGDATRGARVDYDPVYDVAHGGFLSGQGTVKLGLVGYDITIDATALTVKQFEIAGVTSWLDANQVEPLRLLPMAGYQFVQPNGTMVAATFAVLAGDGTVGGCVDYPAARDVSQGGFLSGRGTANLALLGYSVLIDASEFQGTELVLMPLGHIIDTTAPAPQAISLLPHEAVTLELRAAQPKSATFELKMNGRLTLDEPYPFTEVRQQGTQQLLRLTKETLRRKRPCRPPLPPPFITRVSIASDGTQGNKGIGGEEPAIRADGRFVAFGSGATNLVPGDTNGYSGFSRDTCKNRT